MGYYLNNHKLITLGSISFAALACTLGIQAIASNVSSHKTTQQAPGTFIAGTARYEKETLNDLAYIGRVSLSGGEVKGKASVKGALTAYDAHLKDVSIDGLLKATGSTLQSLTINGSADLKKCTLIHVSVFGRVELKKSAIKGEVSVTGLLYGEGSTFEKDITVVSNRLILTNSTAQNIVVKAASKSQQRDAQVIRLKGNTIINGSITFDQPGGIIRADEDVIIKGAIKGGSLEKSQQRKSKQTV